MQINRLIFIGLVSFYISHSIIIPAKAANSVPINVEVTFEVESMIIGWGDSTRKRVKSASQKAISQNLKTLFPYWKFHESAPTSKRTLKIRIVETIPKTVELHLEVYSNLNRDARWGIEWFSPGDEEARRYPNAEKMPKALVKAFDVLLMKVHESKLKKWLQESVPLAKGGEWLNTPGPFSQLQIVLALPLETFSNLNESTFQISAKRIGSPNEKLEAIGLGLGFPYPTNGETAIFEGLVVRAQRRIVAGETQEISDPMASGVRNLKLGLVYLKKEIHSTGQDEDLFDDVDLSEDDDE